MSRAQEITKNLSKFEQYLLPKEATKLADDVFNLIKGSKGKVRATKVKGDSTSLIISNDFVSSKVRLT